MHQWSINKLVPRGCHFSKHFFTIICPTKGPELQFLALLWLLTRLLQRSPKGSNKRFEREAQRRRRRLIHFVRCSFLYWYIFSVLFSLLIHFRRSTMSSLFEIDVLSLIHYEYGGLIQVRGNINLKLMFDWLSDRLTTRQIEINGFQIDLSQPPMN